MKRVSAFRMKQGRILFFSKDLTKLRPGVMVRFVNVSHQLMRLFTAFYMTFISKGIRSMEHLLIKVVV